MEGADLALAGPDAKQAQLRSMGEDTIRRIKEQEAAARTQRDVDYEEGIQRGMERSAGSTADFIKRKELEEGGRPVGVAPAIKVRTPEGDFEEFTEGEALYDPRKWEPKFFIDSTGRPRRHMVKKRKGSLESAHKPRGKEPPIESKSPLGPLAEAFEAWGKYDDTVRMPRAPVQGCRWTRCLTRHPCLQVRRQRQATPHRQLLYSQAMTTNWLLRESHFLCRKTQ